MTSARACPDARAWSDFVRRAPAFCITLAGSQGTAQSRSTSTRTDRCKSSTEITRRGLLRISIRVPVRPLKGPAIIMTRWPLTRPAYGSVNNDDFVIRRIASISRVGIKAAEHVTREQRQRQRLPSVRPPLSCPVKWQEYLITFAFELRRHILFMV